MADDVDQFVRAVHRRHALAIVGESTGIGLLVGVGFNIVLLLVFAFLRRPVFDVIFIVFLLFAACGFAAGLRKRPSFLQSALEADRQLQFSDLLSTACATRTKTDAWAQSVRLMAGSRCRLARPADVVLFRWGLRAWGGLGLSVSLVNIAAILVPSGAPSRSAAVSPDAFSHIGNLTKPVSTLPGEAARSMFQPSRPQLTDDPRDERKPRDDQLQAASRTRKGAPREGASDGLATDSGGRGVSQSSGKGAPLELLTGSPSMSDRNALSSASASGGGTGRSLADSQSVTGAAPTSDNASAPRREDVGAARTDPNSNVESKPRYRPYRDLIRAFFDQK